MELRQLRYFVALAEELNFTRAAARLHISQPPLSLQIAQLEQELGVRLFERTSRRVVLTEAGEVFLHDVRGVLGRLRDAAERVVAVDRGTEGRIEVGLSGAHFLGPLPDMLARYAQSHPDVAVVLHETRPSDQIEALREQRIDLSVSRAPYSDETLRCVLLWRDPVVVALPAGHRLAARDTLELGALRNERFVLLRRGTSAYAQRVYDACAEAGFAPREAQLVTEVPAQMSLVAAGLGVALVPQSVCKRFEPVVEIRRLSREVGHADVYGIMRRDARKRVLETFLEVLQAGA